MKWSLAKRAGWSLAVLAGIAALGWAAIFGRWLALAGPRGGSEAVVRFLRYGDTDIDDFERYPARRLRASAFPRPFAVAPPERSLTSASAVGNERFRDLDHLFGVTSLHQGSSRGAGAGSAIQSGPVSPAGVSAPTGPVRAPTVRAARRPGMMRR